MNEIGTISVERLNNGAHFLFISNVLALLPILSVTDFTAVTRKL